MKILKKAEPRVSEFKIDKWDNPFENKSKIIKSVKLTKISINEQCVEDLKTGKGFMITNEDPLDKKENRTMDGLFSPLYGADTFSDGDADSSYRCECGKTIGAINEYEECEECGTMCKFCDADLSKSGYISLGTFNVINPACYIDLEALIGKKELPLILKYSNKYNISGHNVSVKNKQKPYAGIGIIEFHEKIEEIMSYYRNKRKDKEEHYLNLQRFKYAMFTNFVNPYSSLLRPLVTDGSKMSVLEVNKCYGFILTNANIITSTATGDKLSIIEPCLFEIQENFNEIFKLTIENNLSDKGGQFRNMSCARLDHSTRLVIKPALGHKSDEVSLPYHCGLELMRGPLLRELTKIDGINVREANSMLDAAQRKFSKRIWILMNYLLKNSKCPPRILIQRSPSLLPEAIRMMKIKEIKKDFYDLTMSIPVTILNGLGADFDGDVLSGVMIYDTRLIYAWERMHSPRYHFISRYNGLYSELAGFIKDSAVILSELWEIGKTETYYMNWATEEERNEWLYRQGA
jgi:DNA-directed RNA polymerase beta' subunit